MHDGRDYSIPQRDWQDMGSHAPVEKPKFRKRGRNEPCICGSGLKYKNCCLNDVEETLIKLNKGETMDEKDQSKEDGEDMPNLPSSQLQAGEEAGEVL